MPVDVKAIRERAAKATEGPWALSATPIPTLIYGLCCDGPGRGGWWEIGTSDDHIPEVFNAPVNDGAHARVLLTDMPEGTRTVPYKPAPVFGTIDLPAGHSVKVIAFYDATDEAVPESLHMPRARVEEIGLFAAARIAQDETLRTL